MSGREWLSRTDEQSFSEWLTCILSRIKGARLDITAFVYEQIVKDENPLSAFQFFLENADDITSTEEVEISRRYTDEDIWNLQKKCSAFVAGILNGALERNCTEEEFYSLLWHSITNHNPMLPETDDVIFAIYLIWQDGRIPYFQLKDGIKMTNDEFQEISRQNIALIRKAFFVIHSTFEQRTELCTLLLEVLSDCETEEDKVVVLAQILGKLEQKAIAGIYSTLPTPPASSYPPR